MSQTSQPVCWEASPCLPIEFHVHKSNPAHSISIYKIDCVVDILIKALKDDLADIFTIPASQQEWHWNGKILQDSVALETYIEHQYGSIIEVKHSPGPQ